jgi:uncharacterized protein YvpB
VSELVVNAGELRELARGVYSARNGLSDILQSTGRVIHQVDRRGWNPNELDNRWNEAQNQVRDALSFLEFWRSPLERKAQLVDELEGRAWPGVFGFVSLLLGGWAFERQLGWRIALAPTPPWGRHLLDLLGQLNLHDVGRLDFRQRWAYQLAGLAGKLTGHPVARGDLARFFRSPAWGAFSVGLAVLDWKVTADLDPDRDRVRASVGAFGSAAAKLAFGLLVGAAVIAVLPATPVVVGGLLVASIALPIAAGATGIKWLDPVGLASTEIGGAASTQLKGLYDSLFGKKAQNTVRLGEMLSGKSPSSSPRPGTIGPDFDHPVEAGASAQLRPRGTSAPSQTPSSTPSPGGQLQSPQPILAPAPFRSQWVGLSGHNNCGPAALAMVLGKFGVEMDTNQASALVRPSTNPTGPTNFKGDPYDAVLSDHHLKSVDVKDMTELQSHLRQGHPVIVVVENAKYASDEHGKPTIYPRVDGYANHIDSDSRQRVSTAHIVVVTSYDDDYVYINDPLATKLDSDGKTVVADPDRGTNYRIPKQTFDEAARGGARLNGASGYYASAVEEDHR